MPAVTSLVGDELIPIVQSSSNKTTTVSKIKEGLATSEQLAGKVDKDGSKVLSEKNFTAAYETKLKGIADNANNYTHPAGNAVSKPAGFYKISTDSNSHVASATPVAKSDITALGIPAQDTTYTEATTGAAGLMSSTDKSKLDGIATGANNYTHPTTSGNKHIPSGGSSGQILRWSADGTAVWGNDNNTTYSQATSSTLGLVKIGFTESGKDYPVELNSSGQMFVNVPWTDTNTTYSVATISANGLMSSTDKAKLEGIATGANNYVLPAAGESIGGVKQGAAVTDATSADDIVAQFNALLASLRTAGVIATGAAAASMMAARSSETVIDFVPPMPLEKGKLYKENGIVYRCIQTSKLSISNKLSDLIGHYVELV